MNFAKSNRAIPALLLAALGTVAWDPMALAFQMAPAVGDGSHQAGHVTLPKVVKGFQVLYQFPINVMNYSNGGVVHDRGGDLFGVTYSGGANSYGDVYELTPSGSSYNLTDIHDFTGPGGDGQYPNTESPYLDGSGNLFLTATQGGTGNAGTAIKLSPSGSGYKETAAFAFDTTDGGQPNASLVKSGPSLYTTTVKGGANGFGAIVALSSSTLSEKLLYSFAGTPSDGQSPAANLTPDGQGNLFGTTQSGGSGGGTGCAGVGCGTVFKFVPTKTGGTETVLWNFGLSSNDGENPFAPPIVDSAGNLYGTTVYGGVGTTHGTVWKLTLGRGGYAETILYSFGTTGGNNDGCYPVGGLILRGTTLYGTTSGCGANGDNGTIFSISTTGTNYAILHSFDDTDGKTPEFATWSFKGRTTLYGTTGAGGVGGTGVVWRFVL